MSFWGRPKKMVSTINRIVSIIREKKKIDIVDLCLATGLSKSTIYNYKDFILRLHEDIKYENGIFYVVEEKKKKNE
jgi:ACT domain-containing protein